MPLRARSTFFRVVIVSAIACSAAWAQAPTQTKKPPASPTAPTAPAAPNAPQSKHYPILLLASGNNPAWSLRIGQKGPERLDRPGYPPIDRKSTRLNSSHQIISYAVFCLKKKKEDMPH